MQKDYGKLNAETEAWNFLQYEVSWHLDTCIDIMYLLPPPGGIIITQVGWLDS